MARQKFGVSLGRPKMPPVAKMPKAAQASASPMDAFKPSVPASAYKKGGKVSYHDDPKMCSGGEGKAMTRGLIYWVIMLVWLVLAVIGHMGLIGAYGAIGGLVILFILLVLLGWQVFGPPIRGMSMTLILIILLVLILFGGGYWGYNSYGYNGLGGVVGLVLIVVLILFLTGNLHGIR